MTIKKNISNSVRCAVIGSGRWGTFIAWYLDKMDFDVILYGRKGSDKFQELISSRKNSYLELNESVTFSDNLKDIVDQDLIFISVPAQSLRDLSSQLSDLKIKGKTIILCMKGLEKGTGKRLSEVLIEKIGDQNDVAIWVGPGHPQEFVKGHPSCMVIDSHNYKVVKTLVDMLSSNLIRIYCGTDIIGNEVGAATKNIIGIAGGMLDGMGYSSLKGALMARGTREVSRLIKKMGGNPISAYGLSHLGDYEATLFSKYSHNRQFGEAFVRKEKMNDLAEGVYSLVAIRDLEKKYDIDMPICSALDNIIYQNKNPKDELMSLFMREIKNEFDELV